MKTVLFLIALLIVSSTSAHAEDSSCVSFPDSCWSAADTMSVVDPTRSVPSIPRFSAFPLASGRMVLYSLRRDGRVFIYGLIVHKQMSDHLESSAYELTYYLPAREDCCQVAEQAVMEAMMKDGQGKIFTWLRKGRGCQP